MIRIELCFLAGRYHATAWGTHVNEGVVEWPPGPWRICRALLAVWHRKCAAEIPEESIESLIERLASALPAYSLPPCEGAHSRHFMPVIEGAAEKRTKVLDTFHQLGPSAVAGAETTKARSIIVHWPVDLGEEERRTLANLLESLNYFGRAESLVEARLLADSASAPGPNVTVVGLDRFHELQKDEELVEVMAPTPAEEYQQWQQTLPKAKKKSPKSQKTEPAPSLRRALEVDTDDWRNAGWSRPPGARWIGYLRKLPPASAPLRRRSQTHRESPTVARYAIASSVLPRIRDSLRLTEPVHDYLLKVAQNLRARTPEFFPEESIALIRGTDRDRNPLHGHGHAYLLPECDDQARIRFLTVYIREGFSAELQRVFERLTRLEDRHHRKAFGELRFVLIGLGRPKDFGGLDHVAGMSLPLAESQLWRSLTPFVPTRHAKRRKGAVDPAEEARRDLERLLRAAAPGGVPLPVEAIEPENELPKWVGRKWAWRHFRTCRERGTGAKAGNRGYGFRIRFSQPVRGPLAFGYGAHFGLGLFVPEVVRPVD